MADEDKLFQDKKSLEREEKKEEKKEETKKKPPEHKEEEKKREVVLQRAYTIPLMQAYRKPKYKRADAALKYVREFAERHLKTERVKILPEVNNVIRKKGSVRPLKKVSVIASKDKDGLVVVELKK